MKSFIVTLTLLAMVLFITSCKSNGASEPFVMTHEVSMLEKDLLPPPPAPPVADGSQMAPMNSLVQEPEPAPTKFTRKIIKDGSMEIRVRKLEQGKLQIDSLVKKFQGYYAGETYNNQDFSHDFTLKIRIPSDKFELFIAQAESAIGELVFKNVSSRDVTEEFIDLETRLKNKKNYLNRYGELLKQAKSVKDILEIEEKTRIIEEEIESAEGRLRYLNNQVDFSTLDLRITKKNDYNFTSQNEGNFFDRLKLSLIKGWFGLVKFTLFIIRLWPFWIIAGLVYYLMKKFLNRNRGKKQ